MNRVTAFVNSRRLLGELIERVLKAVGDRHLLALQRPHELHVVVARNAEASALRDRAHREAQHARRVGAAVHEVADEHEPAPVRMDDPVRDRQVAEQLAVAKLALDRRRLALLDDVAELREKLPQLVEAAVDVAHDVERPVVGAAIVPLGGALDRHRVDLIGSVEPMDEAELLLEPAHRVAQVAHLVADDVRAELAVGPLLVARLADRLVDLEHDRDDRHVVLLRDPQERRAGGGLDVRGVDDRETPGGEPLAQDRVQQVERLAGRRLVVLVVGHEPAAEVGRDDLRRKEVLPPEGRLAAAARSDEQHQGETGDLEGQGKNVPARPSRPGCERDGRPLLVFREW